MTALRHRLALLAAATLFSTGGAAIKAASVTPWQIACFRSLVAAVVLALVLPEARRARDRRVPWVALAYALTLILFVLATRRTTAANAIFLQSTAPLYLLALGPWLLREPVRRHEWPFLAVVALGLALFFTGNEAPAATAPDPFTGNLLAAGSAFCWAFTLVGLRTLARNAAAASATLVVGNLLACALCLPFALPVTSFSVADALVIGYLGVFQISLAYLCLNAGVRHVGALEASLLLMVEPALNPLWTWLVHGETPSRWGLAGGALIIGATIAKTVWENARPGSVLATAASTKQP